MRISDWSSDVCSSDLADDKPVLLCCRTTIGFGSPNKAGKESSHGAALGKDEVEATRKALGWEHGPFEIPQEIRNGWRAGNAGLVREEQWNRMFDQYAARHPELAEELVRRSPAELRSEEHTSELQSIMCNSYAVFFLKQKNN